MLLLEIERKWSVMVRAMARVLWVLVLLLVLGGLVASGLAHGWTTGHFGIGLPAAALLVLTLIPTKQPAVAAGTRGR